MRFGIGYDSHRFAPGTPLVLGGLHIPDEPGLEGHSDGDAIVHAVIDALLGAAALGSIGSRFPDTDPALAGIDSLELLSRTVHLIEDRGWRVVNVDLTVIAERPRIAPYAEQMARRLADRLHVDGGSVSVKGKTNEGMGWLGRGEGLAVLAVAALDSSRSTVPQRTGPSVG